MDLENSINEANEYYLENNLALIYKKPTPIGIVKVSYENNSKVIDKAYFKEPSTLDYNGIYKGKYIEFEAKETTNKTSFPLRNIHPHQIKHISKVLEHGGIVFIIIKINQLDYLLDGKDFLDYIENNQRNSITYDYIKEKGFVINYKFNKGLDYLSILDKKYFS
ncbi:MAG: Holliday junction resolvase RecU [Bacilli bacterium]|nr:Holliday junction resolvase RecU [Bacilli bacterium]